MDLSIVKATQSEEALVTSAFALIKRELGLTKNPHTEISVEVSDIRSPEGVTNPIPLYRMFPRPKRTIKMSVTRAQGPSILLMSLCHEMIHVRQILNGDLKIKGKNAYWKGELFGSSTFIKLGLDLIGKNFYVTIPWENEALREMTPLYRKIRVELNDDSRTKESSLR